jgi:hypothetical protein
MIITLITIQIQVAHNKQIKYVLLYIKITINVNFGLIAILILVVYKNIYLISFINMWK